MYDAHSYVSLINQVGHSAVISTNDVFESVHRIHQTQTTNRVN